MKKLLSLIITAMISLSITACVTTDTTGTSIIPQDTSGTTIDTTVSTSGTTAPVKPTPSNNRHFVYELLDDGTYSIAKREGIELPISLVIPSTYLSKPITVIANDAFKGSKTLESVYIPASIKTIDQNAFRDCEKLSKVTFEENSGLTSICESAFASCSKLKQIDLPESTTDIKSFVFASCTSLESIILPEGLTEICENLFNRCTALESVIIPKSVTAIRRGSFNYCTALESIVIPKNVVEIEKMAFDQSALESIVFEKDSALQKFFVAGTKIKQFTFPDNIEVIYHQSLFECPDLETVTIPKSVKKIEYLGIGFAPKLKNIIYEGTKAEWEAIDLAEVAIDLAEYTVTCTDGTLTQKSVTN